MKNTTKVIFRKWHNGDVIALMPYESSDIYGYYCQSYEHVGQHGGADPNGVIQRTSPATPSEFADLKAELESIGYVVEVIHRNPSNSFTVRRSQRATIA